MPAPHTNINPPHAPDWKARITELRNLIPKWDGKNAIPPNDIAAANANLIVDTLANTPDSPVLDRINVLLEGGISMYFFQTTITNQHLLYCGIDCDNEGEVVLLKSDRTTKHLTSEIVNMNNLPNVFAEIKTFLNPQPPVTQ